MDEKTIHSKPTIFFHWSVGLLFITALALGFYVADLPKAPEKWELLGIHKSLGVIALFLAIARLVWRFIEGAIPKDENLPAWQRIAAKSVQHLLLLLTVLMPASGIMMSLGGGRDIDIFGWVLISGGEKIPLLGDIGSSIHFFAPWGIVAIIAIHILAALKHHFVEKDRTLKNMLGIKN